MKSITRTLPCLGVALCLALPLSAQNSPEENRSRDRDEMTNHREPRLGKLVTAQHMLGAEVKDSLGEKIGWIKDFAVDLEGGRIAEVLLGLGNRLETPEYIVALPPDAFGVDDSNHVQLHWDHAKLRNAPQFEYNQWTRSVDLVKVTEVYQYFQTQPYFANEDQKHAPNLKSARRILGLAVVNPQNEKLGRVSNLLLDFSAGRVVEVAVGNGGFVGIGREYCAVPPGALRYNGSHSTVTLDSTKAALKTAPHFQKHEWAIDPSDSIVAVYDYYKVEPFWNTKGVDNTAENVRDRQSDALTPLSQGKSQEDIDITARIRKEIMSANYLSLNAHNVKIITLNGKVTLRGPVNSEAEKTIVGDLAARIAEPANVHNELRVKESN